MGASTDIVHVTFGPSRADSIREALRTQGCEDRVVGLPGAFNYGPIDPPDPERRRAWIQTVLRCDPQDDRREAEAPWAEATAAGVHPVFWVCMTDAGEQACFLAFAARMAGRPFDIVDATNHRVATAKGPVVPRSLGAMRRADILSAGLMAQRRPVTADERKVYAAAWLRLRRENAPLRIIRDGALMSAPLTHYDAALVAAAATNWEIAARLVGRIMRRLANDPVAPDGGIDAIVLFGRILALGDAGALDVRGPGPGLRDSEVRAPRP